MACFVVPAAEAVITTVATKIIEKKEKDNGKTVELSEQSKEQFSCKLKRLNNLLWGGSALLAFEHFWHGEIQPFAPFLTAASNPEDTMEMLHEMSTVGVTMAVMVTCVWGVMTYVSYKIEAKKSEETEVGV